MQNPNIEPNPVKPLSEETKRKLRIILGGICIAFLGAMLRKNEDEKPQPEDTNFEIIE